MPWDRPLIFSQAGIIDPGILLAVLWLRQLAEPQSTLQVNDLPMVMYDDGGGQAGNCGTTAGPSAPLLAE